MAPASGPRTLSFYVSLAIFALVLAVNVSLSYSITAKKRLHAASEEAGQEQIRQILAAADEKRAQASRLRSAAEQLLGVTPDPETPAAEPIDKEPLDKQPEPTASTPNPSVTP